MDAISAAVTAISGLVLFFLGRWSKNKEMREAERTRFHDVRRELYAEYIGAAFAEWSSKFTLYARIKTEVDLSAPVVSALGDYNEAMARRAT